MTAGVCAFTSFTCAELAGALTLAGGLKAHHPQWRRVGVLVDAPPPDTRWREGFDQVFEASALFGELWRAFIFKHDPAEAAAATRGRALNRLFDEGVGKAIYFASDIAVFGDLSDIEARLETASILLTPHQAEPNETRRAFADNEARAMRDGVYNLNFLGVRNDAEGRALARWWAARLDGACYDDSGGGAFNDQTYFDLVPALFGGVEIWRDPGSHVASWNLSRREVDIAADGRILVNGEHPLKFFDFANPYGDGAIMTERYAGRRLGAYELNAHRRRVLAAANAPAPPSEGWAYGRFDDGTPISGMARRLYRVEPELCTRFPDPFDAGPEGYLAYLRSNRADLL